MLRTVPNFPGYAVSDAGRIWSGGSRRWLRLLPDRDGHLQVVLYKDRRPCRRYVHRLVLEAFVGPCPAGYQGCHNNGNPADNRVENLRWGTASSNVADAVRHGTHSGFSRGWTGMRGATNGRAKLDEEKVRQIERRRHAGEPLRLLALEFDVTEAAVCAIAHHRIWKHLWSGVPVK